MTYAIANAELTRSGRLIRVPLLATYEGIAVHAV